MWAKLDDALIDHRKIFTAGDALGRNGAAIALGFYTVGLMWANKHLTDGFLPAGVVKQFSHVAQPLTVAAALVTAGLWERADGGFQIHHYHDHNPQSSDVHEKRKRDRERKKRGGQHRYGNAAES